jgi:hypothetical protein
MAPSFFICSFSTGRSLYILPLDFGIWLTFESANDFAYFSDFMSIFSLRDICLLTLF